MNSWKVILATMVIFGTGVVTGGLLVGMRRSMAGIAGRQHLATPVRAGAAPFRGRECELSSCAGWSGS